MIHEIQQGYVKTETHQGITTIEFFHPQSNSLPGKILEELAKEIHVAGHDDDCKLIILQSWGEKVFCAGASFDELVSITNETEGTKFFSGFANVINAMRKCSKFIIGRIQGKCVGGGVGIAAACDYAIALEGADVKLSELALGIGPFVVGPAIERKIGVACFSQLAIDAASWHSSDWARKKGLFTELYHDVAGMDESIQKLSSFLLHGSTTAMAELKKILWHGTENWDALLHERAAISGKLVLSDFTKNYIKQFKEKQALKK
ncbi:MAG TPA: enoyl-CoA hydratase/isomerase family protein [Parafilimonas sp.]|jgi:methylglutaconyl-CoA hydratase